MDPNLFHVDWERTWEALVLIIVLAFIIERALAIIFESSVWLKKFDAPGVKEIIAVVASIWVCIHWQFDALGMIILTERTTYPGYVLTGLVIAGGSKASIKLFHDVMNIKSTTLRERDAIRAATTLGTATRAAATAASGPNTTGGAVAVVTSEPKPNP